MTRLRVNGFTISLDGYGAGPNQDLANPLGVGGKALHQWLVSTRTFARMLGGNADGRTGVDDDSAAKGFESVGAWIMGRNMFGPVRGPWPDLSWKGWWGDNPPYHAPVFVLTNHPRPSLAMEGGTVFHFVTDGIQEALKRATESAGGKDIRIAGGISTIRQFLQARLIDDMHLAVSPILLGSGESLFSGIDAAGLGYRCTENTAGEKAFHVVLTREG